MKKLLLLIFVFISSITFSQRISELPPATSAGTGNLFLIVQNGVTKKITYDALLQSIVENESLISIIGEIRNDTIFLAGDTLYFVSHWDLNETDLENNNTGNVIIKKELHVTDSSVFNGGVKFNDTVNFERDAIPAFETGDPVYGVFAPRKTGVSTNRQMALMSLPDLYDIMQDTVAKVPTPYATWTRDTIRGTLSPANTTDTVYIPQVVKLGAQLYAPEMGFQLIPSAEMNVLVKNDFTGLIHTYPLSQFQTTIDTSGNGLLKLSTTNSNYVFLKSTSYRLGIGTTTPAYKLDVSGDIRSTGDFYTDDITATGSISADAGTFAGNILINGVGYKLIHRVYDANYVIYNGKPNEQTYFFADAGSSTASSYNLGIGGSAMASLAAGGLENVAMGRLTMNRLTTGDYNTAFGGRALFKLTTGSSNTAVGDYAGNELVDGNYCLFLGEGAGKNQTGGDRAIIIGADVLSKSTTASDQLNIGDVIYGSMTTGSKAITIEGSTTIDGNLFVGNNSAVSSTVAEDVLTVNSTYYPAIKLDDLDDTTVFARMAWNSAEHEFNILATDNADTSIFIQDAHGGFIMENKDPETSVTLQLRNKSDTGHISIDTNGVNIYTSGTAKHSFNDEGVTVSGKVIADTVDADYFKGQLISIPLVCSPTSTISDGQTYYFGGVTQTTTTTAGIRSGRFLKSGKVIGVQLNTYWGTAGSDENISVYLSINNTTDSLIQTVGASTNARFFSNNSLAIDISAGDLYEIKMVCPTWATDPAAISIGGYILLKID